MAKKPRTERCVICRKDTVKFRRLYLRGSRSEGRDMKPWAWVCPKCLVKWSEPDLEGAGGEEHDDLGIPVILVE